MKIKQKRLLLVLMVAVLQLLIGCSDFGLTARRTTPESAAPTSTPIQTPTPTIIAPTYSPTPEPCKGLIVIDAGHQAKANLEQEPIGPGATETKKKVSGGTCGRTTGIPEYEVTLELSLQLQQELEERGYDVIMTRTENDVDISNYERAEIANQSNADAFLRIHCNGSNDNSVNGAMTLCQTPNSPYNSEIYEQCRQLADDVLDCLVEATGCHREYVWETDTMAGINWSKVPVTLVEVGYMTNPEEEEKLCSSEYQAKIVQGIANGVEMFLQHSTSS